MRIVADENISSYLVHLLRVHGQHVLSIKETSPGIADEEVLQVAVREQALLLTEDKRFGEQVFRDRLPSRGIFLIRFPDEHPNTVAPYIAEIVKEYGETLYDHFSVLSPTSFRMHPIP
jgi:predicted nuclease of predicted toxin-antitoxin system